MKIGEINSKDKKFWPDQPDPGFSPERNKQVVDKTIAKYEAMRRARQKEFGEQLGERTDAIASYLAGGQGAHRGRSLERYFGRRYLAYLRGEDIVNEIRNRLMFGSQNDIKRVIETKVAAIKSVKKKKTNKV